MRAGARKTKLRMRLGSFIAAPLGSTYRRWLQPTSPVQGDRGRVDQNRTRFSPEGAARLSPNCRLRSPAGAIGIGSRCQLAVFALSPAGAVQEMRQPELRPAVRPAFVATALP